MLPNRELSFKNRFREPESRRLPLRFKDAWGFSKTFRKENGRLKLKEFIYKKYRMFLFIEESTIMIKKLFVVFLAIFLNGLVKAEVVELTHYDNPHNHYTIQNQEGFTELLGDIHYWDNHNFTNHVNDLFPNVQMHMPSFAAFLPVGGAEPVQVFAAKKQHPNNFPEHPIPAYNFLNILNAEQNHVPNLNAFHSERQLVTHILGGRPQDTQGTFLIFTRSQSCPVPGNDNGNASCYDFYLDLANHFQNINFHVYIDRDFDINSDRVAPKNPPNNNLHLAPPYAQRFEQLVQLILGHIQGGNVIQNVAENHGELIVTMPNGQNYNVNQNVDIKRRFINRINSTFNNHQNDWQVLKENIINGRYSGNNNGNHERIHYHVR